MILCERVTFELGPVVAGDAGRQRRQYGRAVGHFPALTVIEHGDRFDEEILDDEILVAFEPGTSRDDFGLDDLGPGETSAWRASTRAGRPCAAVCRQAWFQSLPVPSRSGLDLRPAPALQPRDLPTQVRVLCLEPGIVLEHLYEQRSQFCEAKPIDGSW